MEFFLVERLIEGAVCLSDTDAFNTYLDSSLVVATRSRKKILRTLSKAKQQNHTITYATPLILYQY